MTEEAYIGDAISPVIPAVCRRPRYWIRSLNYYVSRDHITDEPYKDPAANISPRAEVALKMSLLLDEPDSSMNWKSPESGFCLYDADYAGIFKRGPDLRCLSVFLDFYLKGMEQVEHAEKVDALEETAKWVLVRLNEHTRHAMNTEIIYPTGSDQKSTAYHHWYAINGDAMDQSISDIQFPIFDVVGPMYSHMKRLYHPK